MTVSCARCGNPARLLNNGQVTHPLPDGTLLYPCYGLFGPVAVAWPGTTGHIDQAVRA